MSKKKKGKAELYLIPVDAVVRHCLLIPQSIRGFKTSLTYEEVWPMERWADCFLED